MWIFTSCVLIAITSYILHKIYLRKRYEQIFRIATAKKNEPLLINLSEEAIYDPMIWKAVASNIVFNYLHLEFLSKSWVGEPFEYPLKDPKGLLVCLKDHYKSWKTLKNKRCGLMYRHIDAGTELTVYLTMTLKCKTVMEHLIVLLVVYGELSEFEFEELLNL